MTKQTHIPRCPLSMLYNCSSQTKFQFISYTVIMIIFCAGLLKDLSVGDSQWRRTRPSPRQTFVAPDHTAMRGSRRSKWQLGRMEPTVWHHDIKFKVHQSQHSSDDVRAEFCSDVDSVCCRTKLSTLLRDDWSKNDDEQWGESDLGSCKTTLYKVGLDSD